MASAAAIQRAMLPDAQQENSPKAGSMFSRR